MKRDIEHDAKSNRVRSSAAVYGLTLVAVGITGLLRWLCDPFLGDHLPFVTFFISVAAAAWLGGLRPALLATGLGFGVSWYFFVPPRYSWNLPSGPHLFGLGAYFIVCLAIAAFGEAMHIARRRAEQEQLNTLAERERFRLAAEAVNGIIYEYDITTGHVERQRGLYEVLGYRVDEVPPTAAWWWEQIHPDDHEPLQKRFVELAGNSSVGEYRVRHKDGRWLHVEDRAVLLRGDDGQLRKMIGCTVDVTAKKQADDELQRRETFTSGVLGSITDGFFSLDRDWRITYMNAAGERFLDRSPGDLIGKVLWDEFPGTVGSEFERVYRRVVAGRVAEFFTAYYPNFDRWYELTAYPAPEGLSVYFRDITDRKRVEDALADRTELLNGVLEGTTDVIFVKDLNGRMLLANAACAAAGRSTPAQLVGKTDEELFPPDVAAAIRQHEEAVIAEGSAIQLEETIPVAGEPRVFHTLKAPLRDGSGRVVGVLGISRDITERKREEGRLRQSEARFRAGIEAVSDIVWTNDAQGQMAGEQAAWEKFTGQDRESYQGYGWSHAIHPDDTQPTIDAWNKAVAEKQPFEFEHRVRRADGQWRLCSVRAVPVVDDRGEISEWVGVHTDITERKEDEQRVRSSEARLRRVFESNVVGMIRWDLDRSLILDANAEFLRMTGYVRDDVTSGRLNFRNLTPPEWAARNEEGIRAIQANGHAPPYEKEYFRQDGSRLPLIIAGTRFEDSPSEGISFLIDLSEMKRAEAALRASADRHSYLVKLSDVLRPLSDPIQIQAEASRVLGEQLGANRVYYFEVRSDDYVIERDYTNAALSMVGRYPITSFGPNPLTVLRAGCTASEADVNVLPARTPEEKAAFSGLQIRSYIAVPLVKSGTFVAGLAVHGDSVREWTPTEIALTEDTAERTWAAVERVRAEAGLRKSEERRRLALDAAELGTWHVDPITRFTQTDERFRAIFDTTEDWTDYLQAVAVIHPDDQSAVLEAVATATRLEDPTPYAIEYRIVHPDGSLRWVFANGRSSYEGDGPTKQVVSFDGTVMDITARKQIEQERERLVGQLQEADRRKDEFLATLAHELRNPLAPIRNGLQIMKLAGGNPDMVEKSLGMMERQVSQMTHLIDDLMDLARISGGKIVLQKARLKVADMVQDAVDISRPLIAERGHALVVDMPPEPLYVDGDRTRLAQVFGNLLNNAAKYTETGGRIRVAVERHNGDVVVAVEDNGVGISPHMLNRVFDMFAQVDRSLEKSQGGLGIGLNIVKRLAEMHDGSIVAESDGHGAGSRFVVRLPVLLTVTPDGPDDHHNVPMAKPARRRFLVVDDNRDGATSLAEMLDIMGNETQTAFDGLEAVAVAETFRPDVILMDIGMPKLNGYEACRRIREQPWGQDVVIVAQTGWGQDDDRRKSHEAGFDFHMVKPVDPSALEKMLVELEKTTR